MSARIRATYSIETASEPERAVAVMAGEQSSGTFLALPGETPELKERFGARVEKLEEIEAVGAPSLPGAKAGPIYRRLIAELSWPLDNMGASLPNLAATVAGNLFELNDFSGLRLLDIALPNEFAKAYAGPQFSIAGTRRLAGVADGPLIGTIVKPSVGLGPLATAETVDALARGGIDFIKDDELQADGPHCPFEARARAVMEVIDRHRQRLGRQIMYAFNLTGDLDQMRRRHDLILELGGNCVMASLNSVGLVGMIELRRHSQLPIHAHRNGWGYLSRHPQLGWSYPAWSKLWRLAGVDHMHVNGIRNKFCEDDESVIASARDLLTPMFDDAPMIAMPVFSSGQTAKQAPDTFLALGGQTLGGQALGGQTLGSTDLIFAAGGGILGHPQGIEAGVASLREAWAAAVEGIPLADYAKNRPALASALGTIGR